ncbi:hypothetical protein HD806DRAFT_526288 [Xylariaceae sp. AK1471]|nr:hypothetical protein HD806DRAFT_526288 [Xylariaceae sp. AK1471]
MAIEVAVHEKGITVLYEALRPAVDLVFVHGFTGHPEKTWRKSTKKHGRDEESLGAAQPSKMQKLPMRLKSLGGGSRTPTPTPNTDNGSGIGKDVYWPADLVPITLPDSRVLTYGYDTNIKHWSRGQVSSNTVSQHAGDLLCSLEAKRRSPEEINRPLLFISHSLGGLVVKQALRTSRDYASTKPHFHSVFEATIGVVFFGTPHRGADPRNLFHRILSSSAQVIGFHAPRHIIDALSPTAELLSELRDQFSTMCYNRKWEVYSFQEEYEVGLLGRKIVEDTSSCLDNPMIETKQHISANHMDMCRFSGVGDPEYLKVAAALNLLVDKINTTNFDQPQHLTPSQEPPLPLETRSVRDGPGSNIIQSIDAVTKQSLIDQLYFDKIDERLTALKPAQNNTCRWFLDHPEYRSWHDLTQQPDHGGFLWITGNPGTGKSTLMKFLFEHAKSNPIGGQSQITLSFFFLARGTPEEKSIKGLYRSLLHQLFAKAEDLKACLDWMTADGARTIVRNGWHEEVLKHTLKHAVQKLGSRPLLIFVDALDECNKDQAADMVSFFEELCDFSEEAQVRLQICFSSRHYPTIVINAGNKVTLEHEPGHTEDLERYIRLKLKRLGGSKQSQLLRSEILNKSKQIFLWVVLVIEILTREYPSASVSINKLREHLKTIPPGLKDLFNLILLRDEDNLERLELCLKWILFATRPLTPQELYFAIQFGLGGKCSGHWDPEDVTLDEMKIFATSSSKGLAEVTRNKSCEVQFIHESVREFLQDKYRDGWSGPSGNIVGHGHEALRDCCVAQLNALISPEVVVIPNYKELPVGSEADILRKTIASKLPFLKYSVQNVLWHSNAAQENEIGQGGFMRIFPISRWVLFYNALERFKNRRYRGYVRLVYLLAERNLVALISIHPGKDTFASSFEAKDERYGTPIFAALSTGSDNAARAIADIIAAQVQPPDPRLNGLLRQFPSKGARFHRDFTFSQKSGVASYITDHNDEALTSLFIAAKGAKTEDAVVARLFLSAATGDETTILSPLDLGICNINTRNRSGFTPLTIAAEAGHDVVVQLLLNHGADFESEVNGKTSLWLLLNKGAKLGITNGGFPLSDAARYGHEDIVQLLLNAGADINAADIVNGTPLHCAMTHGHKSIVRLLLDAGADVNRDHKDGWTPLLYAVDHGHVDIARLLIERGAVVQAQRLPWGFEGDRRQAALDIITQLEGWG